MIKNGYSKLILVLTILFCLSIVGCKFKRTVSNINETTKRKVIKRTNLLFGYTKYKITEIKDGNIISLAKGKSCETCAKGNNTIYEIEKKYNNEGKLTEKVVVEKNQETIIYHYEKDKLIKIDTVQEIFVPFDSDKK